MSANLQKVIEETQELSPAEQWELVRIISQSLSRSHLSEQMTEVFWQPRTLDELLQMQQVGPIRDIASLKADFWPEHESIDDFIEYVYQQREGDRLN